MSHLSKKELFSLAERFNVNISNSSDKNGMLIMINQKIDDIKKQFALLREDNDNLFIETVDRLLNADYDLDNDHPWRKTFKYLNKEHKDVILLYKDYLDLSVDDRNCCHQRKKSRDMVHLEIMYDASRHHQLIRKPPVPERIDLEYHLYIIKYGGEERSAKYAREFYGLKRAFKEYIKQGQTEFSGKYMGGGASYSFTFTVERYIYNDAEDVRNTKELLEEKFLLDKDSEDSSTAIFINTKLPTYPFKKEDNSSDDKLYLNRGPRRFK